MTAEHLSDEERHESDNAHTRTRPFRRRLYTETIPEGVEAAVNATVEEDEIAANNQFTITGKYEKNQDTLQRMPAYMRGKIQHKSGSIISLDRRSVRSLGGQSVCSVLPPPKNRFRASFYWLAHKGELVSLKHILMVLMILFYNFVGAAVFYNIERPFEEQTVAERKVLLDNEIKRFAAELKEELAKGTDKEALKVKMREEYKTLLKLEDRYKLSVLYKTDEEPPSKNMWSFWSAFFFSCNVYTTVGYGSIAPTTKLGRALAILYGFIFVPLTLVVVRAFGHTWLTNITRWYGMLVVKFRKARGIPYEEDDSIQLPLPVRMSMFIVFLSVMTVFLYHYDDLSGPQRFMGLDFFTCLYFSYLTMTTIGFGDIMPLNVKYSPVYALMFCVGMPISKVINRHTFVSLEAGVYGIFHLLEAKLEMCFGGKSKVEDKTKMEMKPRPDDKEAAPRQDENENDAMNEMLNNLTVRSIATFVKSGQDIYGGGFGRVNITKEEM